MNIVEFLEARIAEDEAVGRQVAADFAQCDAARAKRGWSPLPDDQALESGSDGDPLVTIGPSRVLAECAAKRAIIAGCWSPDPHTPAEAVETCNECMIMYILAAVYDQHPDYDQAWRVA